MRLWKSPFNPLADNVTEAFRKRVLADCGASERVTGELLAYTQNAFTIPEGSRTPVFPLADETHVKAWTQYEKDAREVGTFEALRRRFVQLRFPIRPGMSQAEEYRAATRKGFFSAADAFAPGLELNRPSELELSVHPTMAGRIPVLVASDRHDFVALVRAFTERNEPADVPDSMGACIVKGLNNWDRVAAYRRAWEAGQGIAASSLQGSRGAAWAEEFRRLVPQKELYQDRFIILSRGPYSATAAEDVGFQPEEWLAHSLVIRREHEFLHYFTQRLFGIMRNNLLDELIADFVGLLRTFGRYRADLALRFLGLETYPSYRKGGRIEIYRGQPPLSDEGLAVLRCLAFRSIRNLDQFSAANLRLLQDVGGLAKVTFALAGLTLEALASNEMRPLAARRIQ